MNLRVSIGVGVLSLVVLPTGSVHAASILLNGNFEAGPAPFSNQDIDIPTGSTAITGWLVTGGGIDLLEDPWDVSDGVRAIDLDGRSPGGIQQTFATIAGQTYVVSFDLSGNPGNGLPGTGLPTIKQVRVSVGGFSEDYTFDSSGQSIASLVWTPVSFSFVALDASDTLSFVSLSLDSSASYGALVDNVGVAPVPEPSALSLLAIGGLVSLCLRYRRSRNDGL